ncbi:MAG TPA: hypothetical protein VGW78_03635 [Candidatus Babeliales bacterium]|jgi:hypothetical protein|nr:hypothetical protein [Candidatus Babeliales bacterium]
MKKVLLIVTIATGNFIIADQESTQPGTLIGTIGGETYMLHDNGEISLIQDNDRQTILPGGCIRTDLNPKSAQARNRLEQLLKVIPTMAVDENLYKACAVGLCIVYNNAKDQQMSLAEQLHWNKQLIHCIGKKIKDISAEHPTFVIRLYPVQKKLIEHAQLLLQTITAENNQKPTIHLPVTEE